VQTLQRGLAAAAEKKRLEREEGGDGEGHSGSRHSRHSGDSSLLKDQEELDAEAAEAEAAEAAALARSQQAVLDITDEECAPPLLTPAPPPPTSRFAPCWHPMPGVLCCLARGGGHARSSWPHR
jgi:hypothetical protein